MHLDWEPMDFLGHVSRVPTPGPGCHEKKLPRLAASLAERAWGGDGPGCTAKPLPLDGCRMLTAYRATNGTPVLDSFGIRSIPHAGAAAGGLRCC